MGYPGSSLEGSPDLYRLVRSGFWLALGGFVLSAGGALFWFFAGRLSSPGDVGYAVSAVSIANMLSTFASLGLGYAVLREVPLSGSRAFSASLLLALVMGFSASLLSPLFSGFYGGFSSYVPLISLLVVSSLVMSVSLYALASILRVSLIALINLFSITARLSIGLGLLLLGFGGFGLVMGFLAAQLAGALTSLILALRLVGFKTPGASDLRRAALVGFSNYPNEFSNQLLASLGVVLLALFGGSPGDVGAFYISLMIVMASGLVPSALASMSIPIMVEKGSTGLSMHSARFGLAIAAPLSIFVAGFSRDLLGVINAAYRDHWLTLAILSISIAPSAITVNIVSKLNTEKRLGEIAWIGGARLATLLIGALVLIPAAGVVGAAIAYIASQAPLLVKLPTLGDLGRRAAALTSITTAGVVAIIIATLGEPKLGIIATTMTIITTIAMIRKLGITTLGEVMRVIKTILARQITS